MLIAAVVATAPCHKTFSSVQIKRAIDAEFHGTRDVSLQDRRDIARFINCARPRVTKKHMRAYRSRAKIAWQERKAAQVVMFSAVASYYDTHGIGACGVDDVQNGYRFASLILPCGAVIRICHGSACVDAEMVDHGPYVQEGLSI